MNLKKQNKFFVLGLVITGAFLFLTSGEVLAKDVNIGQAGDSVRILSDDFCLGGVCRTSWLWNLNGTSAYYNSGRIGIGTSTPGAALHVNNTEGFYTLGSVTFGGPLYKDRGAASILTVDNSGNVYATSTSAITTAVGLPTSATNGQTLRYNNGSWINNSVLYNNGTNVGIGTATTGAKLTLVDHTTNVGGIRFRTAATAVDLWSRASAILTTAANLEATSFRAANGTVGAPTFSFLNDTNTGMYSGGTDILKFSTAGADRMTILANGNVGIGTTAPVSTLNIKQGADDSGIQINGFGAVASSWVKMNLDSNGYGNFDASTGFRFRNNGTQIAYIDASASNGFRIYDNVAFSFGTNGLTRYSMGYNSSTGNLDLAYGGAFTTPANVKFSLTNTGNVGIGTTAPGHKLSVAGSATNYSIDAGNQRIGNVADPDTIKDVVTLGFLNSSLSAFAPGGASSTWALNGNNIYNTNSGNVGIGTTMPTNKLQVEIPNSGSAYQGFSLTRAGLSGFLRFAEGVGTFNNFYPQIQALPVGDWGFKFRGLRSATAGASTPAFALQSANTAGTGAIADTEIAIQMQNWGTNIMTMLGNGNVGIGTTVPGHKLSVTGSATSYSIDAGNQRIGNVADPTATKDVVNLGYLNSSLSAFAPGGASSTWALNGNNIYNTNSGNVGIGTTGPLTTLQVGSGTPLYSATFPFALGLIQNVNNYSGFSVSNTNTGTAAESNLFIGPDTSNYIVFGTPGNNNSSTLFGSVKNTQAILTAIGRNLTIGTFSAKDVIFGTNNTENMRIKSGGNVGIGTTTPTQKLSIGGSATYAIDAGNQRIGNVADPDTVKDVVTLGFLNSSLSAFAPGGASSTWALNGNNIYNTNSGNVGIGTTNPGQQLEITKNFSLPATTGTTPYGIIYKDTTPFIHDFNYGLNSGGITTFGNNLFIGSNAGNFTMGSTATASFHSSFNIAIGNLALNRNTTGFHSVAIGYYSLFNNTSAYRNVAIGTESLYSATTGAENVAIGFASLRQNVSGVYNTSIGTNSLYYNTGSRNTAIGYNSGRYIADGSTGKTTGSDSIFIGYNTKAQSDGQNNQIVIGSNAIGKGSNTATYGDTSMVSHIFEAGNVGIGTTTPTKKLHVNGETKFDGLSYGVTPGSTQPLALTTVEYVNAKVTNLLPGGASSTWALNGNNIYNTNSGNVGIGTTTASHKLTVQGDINFTGSLLNNGTPFTGSRWSLNGTSIFYNTGNVGIGTTSPANLLSLYKDEDAITRIAIDNPNTGTSAGTNLVFQKNGVNMAGNYFSNNSNTYKIATYVAADMFFSTTNIERMRITSGGNVGIGTTMPTNKLQVEIPNSGSAYQGFSLTRAGLSGFLRFAEGVGTVNNFYPQIQALPVGDWGFKFRGLRSATAGASTPAFALQSANTAGTGAIADTEIAIQMQNWGTNIMTMLGNGNVGIGTTAPGAALHVNKTEGFYTLGSVTFGGPLYKDRGAASILTVDNSGNVYATSTSAITTAVGLPTSATNGQTLRYNNGSWINNSVLYNNGTNVGIGTATVGAKLTLADHTTNVGGIRFRTAATAVDLWSRASAILTTAANLEATSFRAANGTVGAPAFSFLNDTNTGMYSGGTDILKFSTASVDRMTILANGNVGIGTTSPAQKLDVVGKIYASGNFKFNDSLYSISVGSSAGDNLTGVTSLGYEANYLNSQTFVNSFGYQAGYNNSGNFSNLIGYIAGKNNTGVRLTAIGHTTGYNNTGDFSTQIGAYAGSSNTGNYQAVLGAYAGNLNKGNNQTAVGGYSGYNDTGGFTSLLGYESGRDNAGAYLAAVGYGAGKENTGTFSTFIGFNAGYQNSGNYITANGLRSAYQNSGNNSSGFGYESLYGNTGGNVVAIGYQAGKNNTVANQFIVQQANINAIPLIQGNFSTGNVGIGTTTPTETLHVNGTAKFNGLSYGMTPGTSQLSALTTVEFVNAKVTNLLPGGASSTWALSGTNNIYNTNSGNVGIGTTVPGNKLDVNGNFGVNGILKGYGSANGNFFEGKLGVNSLSAGSASLAVFGNTAIGTSYLSSPAPTNGLIVQGNVGIGTSSPAEALHVVGNSRFNGGMTLSGNLNMSASTLIVNKITANTIDPLYTVGGVKYSTFASAIVGGVKEEYVGRIKASDFVKKGNDYEAVLDMEQIEEGSDLWVWYKVIDFNVDNVEIFLTPKGERASMYADIEAKKIIVRSDKVTEAYIRLIGKRFDWHQWPTRADDQNQIGGLFVD